ncbi:MAG: ABC transporter substrate-binding protein [Chloroflexi bacterium]|nr:ABC transporter substrate-binding protein [Chloroflexota bacterium]
MTKLRLTLACGDYVHTHALADGLVQPTGIELNYLTLEAPDIFWRMLRHEEFDASELSLSNYIMELARGERRFAVLPIFPYRAFRHAYIWVHTDAGIHEPRDLVGKRVGMHEYAMTLMLFARGMLEHEYGVLPEDIRWVRGRVERVPLNLPPNVRIEELPPGQTLDRALEEGVLDALISTRLPQGFKDGSPRIRRLFPNVREVEQDYYRRTQIFPIMHVIAIRREIYERNRWVAESLTRAFQAAKEHYYRKARTVDAPVGMPPWLHLEFEEEWKFFGGDPNPYGVPASLPTLEAATLYSYEQGLSARKVAVEELFVPEAVDVFGGV